MLLSLTSQNKILDNLHLSLILQAKILDQLASTTTTDWHDHKVN